MINVPGDIGKTWYYKEVRNLLLQPFHPFQQKKNREKIKYEEELEYFIMEFRVESYAKEYTFFFGYM